MPSRSAEKNVIAILAVLNRIGGRSDYPEFKRLVSAESIVRGSNLNNTLTYMDRRGLISREFAPGQNSKFGVVELADWDEYKELVKDWTPSTVKSSKVPGSKSMDIEAKPEVEVKVDSSIQLHHRIHELERFIAQVEPFLREYDVFEFLSRRR